MEDLALTNTCRNFDCPCTCIKYLREGRPSDELISKVDNLIEHINNQLWEEDYGYKGIVDALLKQIEMLGFDQYHLVDVLNIQENMGRKELDREGVSHNWPWHSGGKLDREARERERPNHTYLESE